MAEVWGNPAAWTTEQWLAVVILAFVVVAILVLIHRLMKILQIARQPTYRPNLRPLRRTTRVASSDSGRDSQSNEDAGNTSSEKS